MASSEASSNRNKGLLLMLAGMALCIGISTHTLPYELFWGAAVLLPLGAVMFFRASREQINVAERRAQRAVTARLSNTADSFAERQQGNKVGLGTPEYERKLNQERAAASGTTLDDSLTINDEDEELELDLSTDVSFPLEIQENDKLAARLAELKQLLDQGVIDEHEFKIAKSRLLR